ncbi:unnamed protein product [Candidula unifasciata]|uniref:Zinc finger HIT domain-containing protein 2 n=1 Tax=Candidula unifasciata TaxID=100452 RepID=A0A8S3ZBQ4_9EUPU|nr:unnamed protein product [Candidula unifasciata]
MGYCSLPCYQSEKHAVCSEAFYKECVISELKEMNTSSQDRDKVLKMLSEDLEQKAEEDSDSGEEDDLERRLHGLDMDRDIHLVWSRLTQKEKEDFARMLQDGRLARLIEIWTPWWRCKENHKLVKEQERVAGLCEGTRRMPDILEDIPDISTLLKSGQPAVECRFDLINILYGYCFVSRIHNGCHMECPVDSTQDLLDVSAVLRDQYRCGSTGDAIQKAFDDVCKSGKKSEGVSKEFNLTVLEDVKVIISGPGQAKSLTFMSAALSDLILLLRSALVIIKKELKSHDEAESRNLTELKALKSQVFKAEKKLMFLLSWIQHFGTSVQQLLPMLQFEIETRQSEIEDVEEIKTLVEHNMDKLKPPDTTHAENSSTETIHRKIVELD